MNTTTETDINEEYERLFGMPKQINLFDTDEEYESFRQYILEQPQLIVDNSVLPFNDIHLKPFVEINRERVIEAEKKKEHHIFFIKQSKESSKDYCFAAGYFDLESLQFIILRYSCVAPSNFFAPEDYALQVTRRKRLMNVSKSAFSCRYLTENVAYNNPSEAASHVLGHRADLRQWVNDHGHSLLTCYPSLEDYVPEYMELKRKRLLGKVIGLLQSPIKGVIQAVNPLDDQNILLAQGQRFTIIFPDAFLEVIGGHLYGLAHEQAPHVPVEALHVHGSQPLKVILAVGVSGGILPVFKVVIRRDGVGTQPAGQQLGR